MAKIEQAETLTGRALPGGWTALPWAGEGMGEALIAGRRYYSLSGMGVIESLEQHSRARWQHVSLSFPHRAPSWADIVMIKRVFIGREREAVQFIPPDSEYVNVHPFTFHLWAPLDRLRVCEDIDP